MKDQDRKWLFIGLETLLLAMTSLMLCFVFASKPFLELIELTIYQIFPIAITVTLILILDITWLTIAIKSSFIKNIYVKIMLTWLLFILSAYLIYCLLLLGAYSGMR